MLIIAKRTAAFLSALLLLLGMGSICFADNDIAVSAKACVLMSAEGRCIYEKNPDEKLLIASTTKLMTALLCIENGNLCDEVRIKPEHCAVEGSSMNLKAGESYTVSELLLGLLLASGNDAALAIAEYVSGSAENFVKLMNRRASELGMKNTSFANPHGLDARTHYSTARDMARLMLCCMDNALFRELSGKRTAVIKGECIKNHNRLLGTLNGCVSGKTGYTTAAGRCLVSCCERNGVRFVCVTLSAPNDWADHALLYERAFAAYGMRDIGERISFSVPVISGNRKTVTAAAESSVSVIAADNEEIEIIAELPRFVFAPVNTGETAGEFRVIINGTTVKQGKLLYSETAKLAFPCFYPVQTEGVRE